MSGRPRSRITENRRPGGGLGDRPPPGSRGVDVVAAGGQGYLQGPQQLWLPSSTTRTTLIPRPPPRAGGGAGTGRGRQRQHHGESSAGGVLRLQRAAHGLGQAAGQGEAQPDARWCCRGRRGAGTGRRSAASPAPDSGAAVDDPQLDPVSQGAGGDERRWGGGSAAGVAEQVGEDAFEQGRDGVQLGEVAGQSRLDRGLGRSGLGEERRESTSSAPIGAGGAARAPAWSGSCRAGWSPPGQPVARLVGVASSSARSASVHRMLRGCAAP